ncbi:MAG: hypothetical protein ACREJX_14115, partial [Polyangiaceae bacterium]
AEDLRLALEDPTRASEEAELARALSLAHAPREIPESVHSAIIAKSLEKMASKEATRGRVIRVAFGAGAAALALAAAILLWIRTNDLAIPTSPTTAQPPVLVQARSTAPLFDAPFDASSTSSRIDRIALARSDDLRENMYASWGVK